ncbi:MAG: uroporphyrinogen decarboxylase family protein [bacterium]
MTSKERVSRAIEFRNPDRIPYLHPIPLISDFFFIMTYPASDWQPAPGVAPYLHDVLYALGNWRWNEWTPKNWPSKSIKREDEFGCVREAIMADTVGEVTFHPLNDISKVDEFPFPDPHRPERFERFEKYAKVIGRDKFIIGELGVGLWERAHFLRGFTQALEDLVLRPEEMQRLLDRLTDEWLIGLVEEHAARGCDGVMMTDDWGTQQRLMISPKMWRQFIKPCYARLAEAIHDNGMKFFLHSCGQITDIIEDLIEVGLDVLQKDDLEAIGTEYLAEHVSGRLCFLSPLDVQRIMPNADSHTLAKETKKLIKRLGNRGGGLMGYSYMQPAAIGLNWGQFALVQYYTFLFGHRRAERKA